MNTLKDSGALIKYKSKELEQYIKDQYGLRDNFLVGRVVKSTKTRNRVSYETFGIEEIINPRTGDLLSHYIADSIKPSIMVLGTVEELDKYRNKTVIFQFEILEDNITAYKLVAGEVLSVKQGSVELINDFSDILKSMKIDIEDLEVSGVIEKKSAARYSGFTISSLYKNLIKEIFDKERAEQETRETNILNLNNKLEEEQEKHKISMSQLQAIKSEIKFDTDNLKKLGFSYPSFDKYLVEEKIEEKNILSIPDSEEDLLKEIQNQLYSMKKNFLYEKKTLRQFYSALKTNELIILSGSSGTGKSSLVSAFADVIGAKKRIIPVQPSWTDKQDLLGFYNPLRKQYVSSPLLDVIIEAKENREKYGDEAALYLVCLDELNLAQVEYYLADLLSLRELENEGIQLYSTYEYDQAMEEVEWYVQNSLNLKFDKWKQEAGIDSIKELEYLQIYKNLLRFQPILHIPDNIRFIGTINVDGSTKALSPKVIDRSFIIPLEKQNEEEQEIQDLKGVLPLNANYFVVGNNVISKDVNKKIEDKMQTVSSILRKINANFNDRVSDHIKKYISAISTLEGNPEIIFDEVLLMKILPRINYLLENDDDDRTGEELKTQILEVLKKESDSYKKVDIMVKKSKDTQVLSYWS